MENTEQTEEVVEDNYVEIPEQPNNSDFFEINWYPTELDFELDWNI